MLRRLPSDFQSTSRTNSGAGCVLLTDPFLFRDSPRSLVGRSSGSPLRMKLYMMPAMDSRGPMRPCLRSTLVATYPYEPAWSPCGHCAVELPAAVLFSIRKTHTGHV